MPKRSWEFTGSLKDLDPNLNPNKFPRNIKNASLIPDKGKLLPWSAVCVAWLVPSCLWRAAEDTGTTVWRPPADLRRPGLPPHIAPVTPPYCPWSCASPAATFYTYKKLFFLTSTTFKTQRKTAHIDQLTNILQIGGVSMIFKIRWYYTRARQRGHHKRPEYLIRNKA